MTVMITMFVTSLAVTVVPKSENSYTCYDYSTEYVKEHPDYICITLSQNQWFHHVTHIVAGKLNSDGSLNIHDGLLQTDYTLYGWQKYQYYHFWYDNKTPIRNYVVMQDNTQAFLNYSAIQNLNN